MPVQFNQQDNRLVFTFDPRMDTAASQQCEPVLDERLAQADGPVVFDLKGVSFVSSFFLRLVLKAAKQCGSNFSIVDVEPSVKLVLKTAGLDSLISDR